MSDADPPGTPDPTGTSTPPDPTGTSTPPDPTGTSAPPDPTGTSAPPDRTESSGPTDPDGAGAAGSTGGVDGASAALGHRGPPSALARRTVVGLAICFFVFALVGDAFLSVLYDKRPELFIALNARNRNLILARDYLEWWEFFGIGATRLLVSDPLFFLLGRWYGDAGVRWIERRSPTYGPIARGAERFFGKASYPLVVIAPNNYVCMFAGAGGMSVPVFAALNVTGTFARLLLLWFVTDSVEEPLDWVRELISENRVPFLLISLTLVGLTLFFDRRAGGTEVGGLLHIDEEIAAIEESEADASAPPTSASDLDPRPPRSSP